MLEFLHWFFFPYGQAWWTGQIYSNIFASIITGLAVFIASKLLFNKLREQHEEHMKKLEAMHKTLRGED